MAEKREVESQQEETKEEKPTFDYKNKASFKVSDKFKAKFNTKTAGGETMSADGLIALAHVKGMWKCETKIIQYPSAENNNTCICQATVGGYDYDPVTDSIVKVEYSDIGDANPQNCNRMVAPSFIRMASTRALGRALRKYTNIDMLCTEELGDEDISTTSMTEMAVEPTISTDIVNQIKGITIERKIPMEMVCKILNDTFGVQQCQALTYKQATQLIEILKTVILPQ